MGWQAALALSGFFRAPRPLAQHGCTRCKVGMDVACAGRQVPRVTSGYVQPELLLLGASLGASLGWSRHQEERDSVLITVRGPTRRAKIGLALATQADRG